MCFVPQRRALFRHVNFRKRSDTDVLSAFWLGHVLAATTAHNFWSLIWPDSSALAALASLLFDRLEKHSESRLFYLFPHLHLLSSDSFSSLIFSLLFSDSSHLCFSIWAASKTSMKGFSIRVHVGNPPRKPNLHARKLRERSASRSSRESSGESR